MNVLYHILMKVCFLKPWEGFSKIISINFLTSPFQPQKGGGGVCNRATGNQVVPPSHPQPSLAFALKVQKGGVTRVEQWTFGHDGHHWTYCSGTVGGCNRTVEVTVPVRPVFVLLMKSRFCDDSFTGRNAYQFLDLGVLFWC